MLGFAEEAAKVEKCACGNDLRSTTVTSVAVSVFFRADLDWMETNSFPRIYDEYRGLTASPEPTSVVDMDTFLDEDLS